MIERGRRMNDLESCPKVKFSTVSEFFRETEKQVHAGQMHLPAWKGELYLEVHKGTLTSQAAMKKRNRQGEVLLKALEAFASELPLEQYP